MEMTVFKHSSNSLNGSRPQSPSSDEPTTTTNNSTNTSDTTTSDTIDTSSHISHSVNTPLVSSPSTSCRTALRRFARMWCSRDAVRVLACGQIVSLFTCGTAVTAQLLVDKYNVAAPTTLLLANYVLLAVVYGGWLAYTGVLGGIMRQRWWQYMCFALVDVEANYVVVKAYQYTSLTSIQLLDCLTIPVVMLLSRVFLKTMYAPMQFVGVGVCALGLGGLVVADVLTHRNGDDSSSNPGLGDALCILGACLYAISNVAQERSVRHYGHFEFLACVGLFASVISGIQL